MDDRFSLFELKKQAYILNEEVNSLHINLKKLETICDEISMIIKIENPSLARSWQFLGNKIYRTNKNYEKPLDIMAKKIFSYVELTEDNNKTLLNEIRNLKANIKDY